MPRVEQVSDAKDIFFSDLRIRRCLSSETGTMIDHVRRVGLESSEIEMIRTYARAISTAMTNDLSTRNLLPGE